MIADRAVLAACAVADELGLRRFRREEQRSAAGHQTSARPRQRATGG